MIALALLLVLPAEGIWTPYKDESYVIEPHTNQPTIVWNYEAIFWDGASQSSIANYASKDECLANLRKTVAANAKLGNKFQRTLCFALQVKRLIPGKPYIVRQRVSRRIDTRDMQWRQMLPNQVERHD